ncbi:MAG TPA: glycosyltransferase family 39 protein [Methanobacterium sp.]|nr:MAG: hypothetical protein FGO69_10350 [Methanobacterium sp.]HOI72157.1 glycosyltransferase family 39 protein [Methanobacterium sp.]
MEIFFLIIPALVVFFIALIPTLKFQWPLSWDIYYHAHMAHLYLEQGFTYFDALTYAPFGRPIFYPPLFQYILAFWGVLFNQDFLTVARVSQPFFAFFVLLSFTYVTYKIYNICVAFFAGFLTMSTSLIHRFVLPIPENLALIIFPITIYLYYWSIKDNNYRYALFSGILAGIIFLVHSLSILILVMVITVFTVSILILKRKINLKHFWIFLISTLLVGSIWWLPLLLKNGFVFISPPNQVAGLGVYLLMLGVPSVILMPIGGYLILKRREIKDLLVLTWFLSILFLANIYLLGIDVLSERILTFAVFPLAIIAGLGLDYVRTHFNRKLFYSLAALILVAVIFTGAYYMSYTKPLVNPSEIDVANWFKANGDSQGVVVSSNYKLDPVIVAVARQPVATGGYDNGRLNSLDIGKYINGNFAKSDVISDKVGYIVLDVGMETPPYFTLVYQNERYMVFRLEVEV